jgi:hypothetical protein
VAPTCGKCPKIAFFSLRLRDKKNFSRSQDELIEIRKRVAREISTNECKSRLDKVELGFRVKKKIEHSRNFLNRTKMEQEKNRQA